MVLKEQIEDLIQRQQVHAITENSHQDLQKKIEEFGGVEMIEG